MFNLLFFIPTFTTSCSAHSDMNYNTYFEQMGFVEVSTRFTYFL